MSQPPSRLSSSLLVRKDEVPDSVKPPSVPPPAARMSMTYRPKIEVHEKLRTIAFNQRRPIQSLIDEAVEAWIDAYQP